VFPQLTNSMVLANKKSMHLVLNMFIFTRTLIGHIRSHTRGYKDGLQPKTLADGNWLVKQNQPVSKIETKSDTNLGSV